MATTVRTTLTTLQELPLPWTSRKLSMNAAKVASIAILMLFVQGCRINQVVSEGGELQSLSGNHDCAGGQTCVIDIPGIPFSDTFTAVPDDGYKFAEWARGLCKNDTTGSCSLQGIPVGFTSYDVDTYLEPVFEKMDLPDLLPANTRGALQIYPGVTGAIDTTAAPATWGTGALQILQQYGTGMNLTGAAERVLMAQLSGTPDEFVLLVDVSSSDFATLTLGASLTQLETVPYPLWAIDGSANLQLIQFNDEMLAIAPASALAQVLDVYTGDADSIEDGSLAEYTTTLELAGIANSFVYGLPALYGPVPSPGDGAASLNQAKAVNGFFTIDGDTLTSGALNFFSDDAGTYSTKMQDLLSGLASGPSVVAIDGNILLVILNGLSIADDIHPLLKTLVLDMNAVDYAESIVHGGNPPWMNFEVGGDPAAIFINFEIPPANVPAFEAAHLPAGFTLTPWKVIATDTPSYFLVLNIYQASGGLVNGARAEWSVFIADPDTAEPRFLVIEAKADSIAADSINLLTTGEPITYTQTPTSLDTWVGVDESTTYFSASIPWPQIPEVQVPFDRAFMSANDYVFWGNAVADRVLYNSTAHNIDAIFIDANDITIEDNSTWSAFINPTPVHAVVYDTHQEIVISPWWNLDATYLELDTDPSDDDPNPNIPNGPGDADPNPTLDQLVNFKNNFYPFTVQGIAADAIRGDAAALSSMTTGDSLPTARYHFTVTDPTDLLDAVSSPGAHTPMQVELFAGEAADYYLTLSVYQRENDLCGARAEWTTYVAGPDGRADSLRLDSSTAEACLDPVALMTLAGDVSQSIDGSTLTTLVTTPFTEFEATVDLSMASPTLAGQNWLEATEWVCSLNGICDKFYYDGQLLMGPAQKLENAAVIFDITTPWDAHINTTMVRVGVRDTPALQAFNPWRNLRSFAADNPAP